MIAAQGNRAIALTNLTATASRADNAVARAPECNRFNRRLLTYVTLYRRIIHLVPCDELINPPSIICPWVAGEW